MARWLHGLGVSGGEAVGPVARLASPPALPPSTTVVVDAAGETARASEALIGVAEDLQRRASTVTGAASDVLIAQSMIAGDPVLMDGVTAKIETGEDAPHAVDAAIAEHRRALEA